MSIPNSFNPLGQTVGSGSIVDEVTLGIMKAVTSNAVALKFADYPTFSEMNTSLSYKQDKLAAGDSITINNNIISVNANGEVNATDTKPVSGQTVNAAIAAAVIGAGGAALDGNNMFTGTNTFSGMLALAGPATLGGAAIAAADLPVLVDLCTVWFEFVFQHTEIDKKSFKFGNRNVSRASYLLELMRNTTRVPDGVREPSTYPATLFHYTTFETLPAGWTGEALPAVPYYNGSHFGTVTTLFSYSNIRHLPTTWTMGNVTDATFMFSGCSALEALPSGMTLARLENGTNMFTDCSSLTDLGGLTLESLTKGNGMFYRCWALTALPPSMTLESLTDSDSMFYLCSSLTDLGGLTLDSLINSNQMFRDCKALATFPCALSNLEVGGQPDDPARDGMFRGCTALQNLPNINLASLKKGDGMFAGCQLSEDSAMRVLNSLPAWDDGAAHCLTLGKKQWFETSASVIALLKDAPNPLVAGTYDLLDSEGNQKGWKIIIEN